MAVSSAVNRVGPVLPTGSGADSTVFCQLGVAMVAGCLVGEKLRHPAAVAASAAASLLMTFHRASESSPVALRHWGTEYGASIRLAGACALARSAISNRSAGAMSAWAAATAVVRERPRRLTNRQDPLIASRYGTPILPVADGETSAAARSATGHVDSVPNRQNLPKVLGLRSRGETCRGANPAWMGHHTFYADWFFWTVPTFDL